MSSIEFLTSFQTIYSINYGLCNVFELPMQLFKSWMDNQPYNVVIGW